MGPKLSEFEKAQKESQREKERAMFEEQMKSKYEDFDPKAVNELYQSLFADGANMGTLMEYLYFAHKGKGINPTQIEKGVIDKLNKKKDAGIPSGKGGGYTEAKPKYKDMRQLAEKLKAEAGDS